MSSKENLNKFCLHMADSTLVLGHRLSEWCGHGPVLEQDIAMTNIALDLIGQARMYFQLCAELNGAGTEDDLAYRRDVLDYTNHLLVEQPNGDFGETIARQFFFDTWHLALLRDLSTSPEKQLADIAQKAIKEVTYHQRWSSEWVIRLGDGTEESHQRMQAGVDKLWEFTGELFEPAIWETKESMLALGYNLEKVHGHWNDEINRVLKEATLAVPQAAWMQSGGKTGYHSEHLGYILADMQFLQRAYPDATW